MATHSKGQQRKSGGALSAAELADFEKSCLESHNKYRAMHGCPPLSLNRQLCKLATEWAQNLAKHNKMEHRPKCQHGENIYLGGGEGVNPERPVELWYNEIKNYNFAASKFVPNAGHFTQLIWRDTTEVGLGVATKGDKLWVVANYTPPGNVQGLFKENVPPKRT